MTKRKENPGKRGAHTKYREDYARQAYVLCADGGATDVQLARVFGVVLSTIHKWRLDTPEFSEAIKRGKNFYDTEVVEKNLLKRANGYNYTEVIKEAKDGELAVSKTVRKEMPPDVTAQIFWLKNRHPDRWREKQAIDLTMSGDLASILSAGRKRLKNEGGVTQRNFEVSDQSI